MKWIDLLKFTMITSGLSNLMQKVIKEKSNGDKSIIENSGGVLQITSENNIFSVHIMLPDKENKIE